jgi:hypothetical protein
MHYAFFLERLVFSFQFCLVLFAAINGWTPTNFFWRSCLAFHLPRTFCFSLLSFNECSLFLELCLAFIFHLDLCSDLVISMWVFIKRVGLKRFEWCWKREKISCKQVVQKGACVDYGLDFCMSCLMSF